MIRSLLIMGRPGNWKDVFYWFYCLFVSRVGSNLCLTNQICICRVKGKPTASSVSRRSPIQVLSKSHVKKVWGPHWCFQHDMAIGEIYLFTMERQHKQTWQLLQCTTGESIKGAASLRRYRITFDGNIHLWLCQFCHLITFLKKTN